jgi:head-tail adaptor
MTAGDLRERVRFERRLEAGDDSYGNIQYEWQKIAGPMPARIEPARGSEEVLAQRLAGVGIWNITVRWSQSQTAELASGDRAVNERSGELFNVRSIINADEHRRYLTITAQTGIAT